MTLKEPSVSNLDGLIQRVKKEAIEAGNAQSQEIVTRAEQKAAEIMERAERTAAAILKETDEEIKKQRAVAQSALQQAARDAVISVQNLVSDMLNTIILQECTEVLSGTSLETIVRSVIEGWRSDTDGELDLDIILNKSDREALSGIFMKKLQEQVTGDLELKAHPGISAGFRIKQRGRHYYYDFTDRGITKLLSTFLNKELAATIDPPKNETGMA